MAPARWGRRYGVVRGVGNLETEDGNVVGPVTYLEAEEVCGPLQDAEGAVKERGQRRLRAIPTDQDEPGQKELLWPGRQRWYRIVARGKLRPY